MSERGVRAVILAAGTSSRVGRQKLLLSYRGRPMIEYAIAAAQRWEPVVVCGAEVAAYLADRADVALVRNDEPERGMSYSLALAHRFLPSEATIVVLLGDKPHVSDELVTAIVEASGADIVFPARDGVPGHPVLLSPRARACVEGLPAGDTLRFLRADARLTSRHVEVTDEGAFFDVDTIDYFPGF